ncbi:head GIN domain-containing protein [Dehalogenimonas sp. THU2]|uniref:head GIN domain-containing protein n=1 Tax=Dehalogenimonas sp. THU2 TaxID=3151121 RepID=UPI0032184743
MFKKTIILLIVLSFCVTAAGCFPFGSIVGRGPVETRNFEFSGFTRIVAATAFDVEVVLSSDFSVTVTTNENLFEYMDLQQNGDTLTVQLRSGSYSFASLKARITMPDLFSLEVSGASSGQVSDFNFSHALTLKASGASSIDLSNVRAGDVEMEISGASRVRGGIETDHGRINLSGASTVDLAGNGRNYELTASGASNATLRNFTTDNTKVVFSGASSGSVNSDGQLDVSLSGASSLRYFGNPTVGDVDVSGGSSFSRG